MKRHCLTLTALALLSTCPAQADLVEVWLEPSATNITVGDSLSVDIRANITGTPVIGWGLDFSYDTSLLTFAAPPTVGPIWATAPSIDGDNLAGLAFPTAISGDNLLIATITMYAQAPGQSLLSVDTTANDFTEGFALAPPALPGTFAPLDTTPTTIHIAPIPEPTAIILAAIGLLLTTRHRH